MNWQMLVNKYENGDCLEDYRNCSVLCFVPSMVFTHRQSVLITMNCYLHLILTFYVIVLAWAILFVMTSPMVGGHYAVL